MNARRHFAGAAAALAGFLAAACSAAPAPAPTIMSPTPTQPPAATAAPTGVPAARLETLKRGVNLSRWFWNPDRRSDDYFAGYITDEDLQILKELGARHVRLVIDPALFLNPDKPGEPDARMLAHLDKAVDRLLAKDIAVIIDMHDEAKKKWESDDAYVDAFEKFWSAIAKRYAGRDPDKLFFEILNEPVFDGIEGRWIGMQPRFVKAIRAAAPNHTIIATGPNWGGIDGLLKLAPVDDRNVVYSFHFYDPFAFTHQGATWSSENVKGLAQLPYPFDAERCAALGNVVTSASSRQLLLAYCAEKWDAARMEQSILRAVNWGKQHGVPVYMGEYGAYPVVAPPLDRLKWLSDAGAIIAKLGLPSAVWAYDDAFGLQRSATSTGRLYYDKPSAEALGFAPR